MTFRWGSYAVRQRQAWFIEDAGSASLFQSRSGLMATAQRSNYAKMIVQPPCRTDTLLHASVSCVPYEKRLYHQACHVLTDTLWQQVL